MNEKLEPGWGPLAVLMGGIFLVVLDFFIVNVALPSLQHDLHATSSGIEWVVAGYGLTFSTLLIAVVRLGERWGRRRMYLLGIGVFVLASAACGPPAPPRSSSRPASPRASAERWSRRWCWPWSATCTPAAGSPGRSASTPP